MESFQQRVVDEKAELDSKIVRLRGFLGSDTFAHLPGAEQERMTRQLTVMEQYSSVLGERVAAF
jgi:hypothetical protein